MHSLLLLALLLPIQDGYLPPADPFMELNVEWATHGEDFIPEALQPPPAPKPKPKAPRADSGMGSGVEQWRGLVEQYFTPGDVNTALCVMAGESGGNPGADNPRSSAAGLWQFLKSTWNGMVPVSVTGGSYAVGRGV